MTNHLPGLDLSAGGLEDVSDLGGPDPLPRVDEALLFVAHLHQALLDLRVRRDRALRVTLVPANEIGHNFCRGSYQLVILRYCVKLKSLYFNKKQIVHNITSFYHVLYMFLLYFNFLMFCKFVNLY